MRRGGLVTVRRDGKFMLYQLSDNSVLDLVAALQTIAERHLAEVDRIVRSYFRDRDNLEAVSRKELMRRPKDGLVTVLDVRPEDEYALGHLPGAINIPLKALTRQLKKLDRSREIIAYCRGAYCVLSFEAVAALRARGFKARRLEDERDCRLRPVRPCNEADEMNEKGKMIGAAVVPTHDLVPGMRRTTKRLSIVAVTAGLIAASSMALRAEESSHEAHHPAAAVTGEPQNPTPDAAA
jgi:rhodanese-related sulfurtransferase